MRLFSRLVLCAAGLLGLSGLVLGVRRSVQDASFDDLERTLRATQDAPYERFEPRIVADLPEPARRYLLHAIAPGTPLAPSVQLAMTGTMRPSPDRPEVELRATEALAPRRGFVWTAQARMGGVPVRVRDHYAEGAGGLSVAVLGLVPLPSSAQPDDVARSARGRLVAEGVWCPTALVHPSVTWEAVSADQARYTIRVGGEAASVTIRVAPDGALREASLLRWGDADGPPWRWLPYGFRVEEERTFNGVTIPSQIVGGWHWGTERLEDGAARFTVTEAHFGDGGPRSDS